MVTFSQTALDEKNNAVEGCCRSFENFRKGRLLTCVQRSPHSLNHHRVSKHSATFAFMSSSKSTVGRNWTVDYKYQNRSGFACVVIIGAIAAGLNKTQVTFHRPLVAGHCFTFLNVTQYLRPKNPN